jgi:Flp pilus assembly protein TadG
MRRINRYRSGERGVAVVEFALILPVLMMLALVVSEFAAMIQTHQVLNNAAREGARVATLPDSAPIQGMPNTAAVAAAQTAAVNYAAANGVKITTANVAVDQNLLVPTAGGVGQTASQVTVTYTYTLNYLPSFSSLPVSVPMTLSAEFKNFY